MNRLIVLSGAALVLGLCMLLLLTGKSCNRLSDSSYSSLYEGFKEPDKSYRGKAFWAWNGDLKKDELIRQIHIMREMGLGGFFMQARTGLVTEYLGKDWFSLVNACVDEAKKLGMEAWLFDEDRWPSGTAGGMITKDPAYRAKFLDMQILAPEEYQWDDDILAAFSCLLEDMNCYDCVRILPSTARDEFKGKAILVFRVVEAEKSNRFNGQTDIDRLNARSIHTFLNLTHEQYKKHCETRFGQTIRGVYTSEPHRQSVMTSFQNAAENSQQMTAWTETLPAFFKKEFGYDIIDHLPALFLFPEGERIAPVKWHYMEILQQMFLENWVKPYQEWCENNDIAFAGHFLQEDNLTGQSAMHGSLMRAYEHMTNPGFDILTENNLHYWVAKQVQSVARQTGKKWILSQLYAASGWQTNFHSYKSMGNWQALFGVNQRCLHISWYTMGGQAKRDYPASILHQSPWWTDWNYIESYFARLGYMLSQGDPLCDVLVINPIESVWAQIHSGWARIITPTHPSVRAIEESYRQLFYWLQGNQIDFDYADEEMLGRLYQIEVDKTGTAHLRVGNMTYKVVVVGKLETIRSSTLRVLEEFKDAGGVVIFAGDAPSHVDALPSSKPNLLSRDCLSVPLESNAITRQIKQVVTPIVQVVSATDHTNENHVYVQTRKMKDKHIVVVMNMKNREEINDVVVNINTNGFVSEWDCTDAKRYDVLVNRVGGKISVPISLAPAEARVFVVTKQDHSGFGRKVGISSVTSSPFNTHAPTHTYTHIHNHTHTIGGPYNYQLHEKNICVLDLASYQIDNISSDELTEILIIDRVVRNHYNINQRSGEMIQPWFRNKFKEDQTKKGLIRLNFSFHIETLPKNDLELCLELSRNPKLSLNGNPITIEGNGQWIDKAFTKINIPTSFLTLGENNLEKELLMCEDTDLEAMYLIGDFAVILDGSRKILTSLPEKVMAGDIVSQGFPFYSGAISYHLPFDLVQLRNYASQGNKVWLYFPQFEAAFAKIGSQRKMLAWPPYSLNITNELARDKSYLEVELMITRRNTFGPLHQIPFSRATGPENFITTGNNVTHNYVLFSSGLLLPPQLIISK